MENRFIYYDKRDGKVLTFDEAKAEWDLAKQEKRPSFLAMTLESSLIIEDGYVKEKIHQSVADLVAKSKIQEEEMQKAQTIDSLLPPASQSTISPSENSSVIENGSVSENAYHQNTLLPPPNVPAPEPLIINTEDNIEQIIDEIIADVKSDKDAKEKTRNAIIDEIIEGVRNEEQKQDAVLNEIIAAVVAEDEAIKAAKAKANGGKPTITDILEEAKGYPTVNPNEYDIDSIIAEYGSKESPRFIDITQDVLPDAHLAKQHKETKPTPLKEPTELSDEIDDPEYAIRIVNEAQRRHRMQDLAYSKVAATSITRGETVDFERTGEKRGIKYDVLVKSLISIAAVAIIFSASKKAIDFSLEAIDNFKTNSAITDIIREYSSSVNFINKNKIRLEGTFDSYGYPAYWIDTKGVAKDILNMPDEAYIASLYLAYNQLGNDKENGPYHNLDDTISYISNFVDETHPTAFLTTAGCKTFNEFLTQAGYFDSETKQPSTAVFEQAGKDAIMEFANMSKNSNLHTGGR